MLPHAQLPAGHKSWDHPPTQYPAYNGRQACWRTVQLPLATPATDRTRQLQYSSWTAAVLTCMKRPSYFFRMVFLVDRYSGLQAGGCQERRLRLGSARPACGGPLRAAQRLQRKGWTQQHQLPVSLLLLRQPRCVAAHTGITAWQQLCKRCEAMAVGQSVQSHASHHLRDSAYWKHDSAKPRIDSSVLYMPSATPSPAHKQPARTPLSG